ncbi:hypothetical protein HAX54_039324 [Datura stramonium]|uniref:Uncharacterized protein n=1 Tax=Datura stramonium TaxID=4076 RepID=A0ABS8SIT3_DATST|nr:hypothetical protein [Datura stramonium]
MITCKWYAKEHYPRETSLNTPKRSLFVDEDEENISPSSRRIEVSPIPIARWHQLKHQLDRPKDDHDQAHSQGTLDRDLLLRGYSRRSHLVRPPLLPVVLRMPNEEEIYRIRWQSKAQTDVLEMLIRVAARLKGRYYWRIGHHRLLAFLSLFHEWCLSHQPRLSPYHYHQFDSPGPQRLKELITAFTIEHLRPSLGDVESGSSVAPQDDV